MITILARHKFDKFRRSKMILIFLIAGVAISLLSLLPVIIAEMVSGMGRDQTAFAASYIGSINFFGILVAIALGVMLWRQDQKDGTLLTFLAKPLSRIDLFLGKLLAAIAALLIYLLMTIVVYALVHLIFFSFDIRPLVALYLLQVVVVWLFFLSLGLFLSSFFNSLLSAVMVVIYIVIGQIGKLFSNLPFNWSATIGKIIKFFVYNSDQELELQRILTADFAVDFSTFAPIAYALLWSVMLLSASIILFSRREFTGKRS